MSMPAVVRITGGSGPAVVRVLPAGLSVTLPQALGTTASPTFVGLTLSGRSGDSGKLAVFGAGGAFGALTVGSGLSIVNGVLTATASGAGTVTSVGLSVPTGLSIANSPITTNGTLAITLTAGYGIPTTASQATWDTAYSERNQWDGSSAGLNAATGRATLGLGSAAQSATTDFATAAQGAKADTAVQPAGLSSYVQTSDARLSDARTPTAHNQAFSTITSTPTTLSGYGITDGFTQANVRATPITGFTRAAGTVAATDSILQAIQKLDGNDRAVPTQTLTYAATIDLDLAALTGTHQLLTLTGDVVFTTSNRALGRWVTLWIDPGASTRTLTFPPEWTFYSVKPGTQTANKRAVMALKANGTGVSDIHAAWKEAP